MTTENPSRDERGRLMKGNRASLGRPAGSSERDKLRELIKPHRQAIVEHLVKAVNGDEVDAASVKAAGELLGYLSAKPRPQAERVVVPGLKTATTLADKCTAVLDAIAAGDISADAGRAVLGALSDAAKILQVDDLEKRIRRLEGKPPRVIDAHPDDGSDLA